MAVTTLPAPTSTGRAARITGWTITGLDRFFYHTKGRYDVNGHVVPDGLAADYPAHGLPFYPDFERLFRRIR